MKVRFKDKLRYKFEQYLNKGGSSIFITLFVVFISLFAFMNLIRWTMLFFWPDLSYTDSFLDDMWITWLQMTAPGNMNQDSLSPTWLKITTIMSGLFGVIVLSMLIAFITTTLEQIFYNFRKGRGKILEQDFTLILGWNERVVDIIREIILANESEKYAAIVILAQENKEVMDDLLTKRIPDSLTTRIITTTGDYANINELKRVSITEAKSVILLANCSESAFHTVKVDSDVQSIKSIMAMISCQNGENEIPIIAEIFNEDKRELVGYFEDENIITIDSWDIMGKLLVQTSLTSGLEIVYNEILSFDGGEIYFYNAPWNGVTFGDLPYHFKDGIPLGIYNEYDQLTLRPGSDYVMQDKDEIIILAEDDSTINFESQKQYQANDLKFENHQLEPKQKSILILGWHNVAEIFIKEAVDYLLEGSTFTILFNKPNQLLIDQVEVLKNEYLDYNIVLKDTDPLKIETLEKERPFEYENILILSQTTEEAKSDKVDSDTLIILLLLRKIKEPYDETHTKIITQVLNSENQEIIVQTDVDDFIISNKLITMILAQLSEESKIMKFYEDIFSEDGSEIYVKPAYLYHQDFPIKAQFADIINLVSQRDEICLGIRKGALCKDMDNNFGVVLNPKKDQVFTIEKDDFFVVLSEDEL